MDISVILDMKSSTLLGKVQLLLNHQQYPCIIHTKQHRYKEVQIRLENTHVQLRVWLQQTYKNDWTVLRERRKYILYFVSKDLFALRQLLYNLLYSTLL